MRPHLTPSRHVHPDLHTSEHDTDMGRIFDPPWLQEPVRLGRGDAVNVCAKRHHDWNCCPTRPPGGPSPPALHPLGSHINAGGHSPRAACPWVLPCPGGAYLDLMPRQTAEVRNRYPVDGFWYDICNVRSGKTRGRESVPRQP